jgi:hypothetical protein
MAFPLIGPWSGHGAGGYCERHYEEREDKGKVKDKIKTRKGQERHNAEVPQATVDDVQRLYTAE